MVHRWLTCPNEFLAKYPTFGSNRVYLKFTPDYYSYLDKHFVGKNIEEIKQLDCKAKYIRREYASKVPGAIPMLQAGGLGSFRPCLDFALWWIHDHLYQPAIGLLARL